MLLRCYGCRENDISMQDSELQWLMSAQRDGSVALPSRVAAVMRSDVRLWQVKAEVEPAAVRRCAVRRGLCCLLLCAAAAR